MNIDASVLNKAALKLMNDPEFVKATPVTFLDQRERSVTFDVCWQTKADYRQTVARIMKENPELAQPDPTYSSSVLTDQPAGTFTMTASG